MRPVLLSGPPEPFEGTGVLDFPAESHHLPDVQPGRDGAAGEHGLGADLPVRSEPAAGTDVSSVAQVHGAPQRNERYDGQERRKGQTEASSRGRADEEGGQR
uniref:(northern house mosquito) hypothetical protein n=1 Tax=Culex pipiens TaxID=7175 RepID=A0A8D8BJ22_CULPI